MSGLERPRVVAVDQVILHIVDPPGSNRRDEDEARDLQLSETPLPPSTDPRVFTYFQNHVANALADDDLRAASFAPLPADEAEAAAARSVRDALGGLLRDGGSLVEGSSALARRLHAVMAPRGRISTGDLAVCLCRGAGGDGDWSRFVAVLKIDPTEGFPQTVREVDGRRYVAVELGDEAVEVLPTTRQRLQKAALVRQPDASRGDYDMLLLDRQTGGLPGHVARFFAVDFLRARVLPVGAVTQTRIVYEEVIKERNASRASMSREQWKRHEARFKKLMAQDEVTVEDAAKVFTGAARKRLEVALRARLGAGSARVAKDYGVQLTRKRKFKGQGDLKVEASASAWGELLVRETYVENDAGPDYWEIVLHTETWDEVP